MNTFKIQNAILDNAYVRCVDVTHLFIIIKQMNTSVVNTDNDGSDCHIVFTVLRVLYVQPHPITLTTQSHASPPTYSHTQSP